MLILIQLNSNDFKTTKLEDRRINQNCKSSNNHRQPRQGQWLLERKLPQVQHAGNTHIFVPLAVETLGDWGDEAFVAELGRRMTAVTGGSPRDGFPPSASLGGDPARQYHCLPRLHSGGGCSLN